VCVGPSDSWRYTIYLSGDIVCHQDPFGWIDDETGVYHALFHTGNGLESAGSHCWSVNGRVWECGESACYTGRMSWAADTEPAYAGKTTILNRRERPQLLLSGEGGQGSSYGQPLVLFTSAEDCCEPVVDGRCRMVDGGYGLKCSRGSAKWPAVGTTKSYTVLQSIATE
jgi:hypothetical protein